MSKIVYMLFSGEDGVLEGVFSSRCYAEKFAKLGSISMAKIEEWQLDWGLAELENGLKTFRIAMERDGTSLSAPRLLEPCGYVTGLKLEPMLDWLGGVVWAKDAADALAIADKERLRLIEAGEWKTRSEK